MDQEKNVKTMEKIVSLCKRRGFIFPSSEIYGGYSGFYDYGFLGLELKNNIKKEWWKRFVYQRDDMTGIDAAVIMNPRVWEATDHIKKFVDPLVDCKKCKKRFRADQIDGSECPECGGGLTDIRNFNAMFKTYVGALEDESSVAYLRPETAGGIFVNFRNITEAMRMKIPFGIAQIGKAFRNEITLGNFIFRTREFEQMEIEYFVEPKDWQKYFNEWVDLMKEWCKFLGIKDENLVLQNIPKSELAHYSKKTIDFEFKYPFGQKELYGLAYRPYDLSWHQNLTGQDLTWVNPTTKEKFHPHVIEPSLGVDRSVLAALIEAYTEVEGGRTTTTKSIKEKEVVLKLPYELAPIKVAILPLSKKEVLVKLAHQIEISLRKRLVSQYDETGSIGKRYRRQDEIGTPYCVTVDFESLENGDVTVRDRDTMEQERVGIDELKGYLEDKFKH